MSYIHCEDVEKELRCKSCCARAQTGIEITCFLKDHGRNIPNNSFLFLKELQ